MSDSRHDDWHRLFSASLNDRLNDEEQTALATLLSSNAEARQLWFLYHDNECSLVERGAMPAIASLPIPSPSAFRRRTLAAAAACFVFGIGCASAIFAYFAPSVGKITTVLRESFEADPPPEVTGMSLIAGRWSGDYSRITIAEQGVAPADGTKMLRFLRGDYEGRPLPDSHSSDVFQLIDVRPYRREFADGNGVVQLTALFNAAANEPKAETYGALTIFALDAAAVERDDLSLSRDSLTYSRSSRLWLDADRASWQGVSNELRIPSETEFLMIRVGVSYDIHRNRTPPEGFVGHFVDDVRLALTQRPKIPVP